MNNKNIKAGIIGGAGYTGGEMLRILMYHPYVSLSFIHSRSNANEPVSHVHADLLGDTALTFTSDIDNDIDVLFLCVGHGEAAALLQHHQIREDVKIIDLSQDFRLHPSAAGGREFIYGLPEVNKTQIRTASNIANPGCFATAIQLALLPLASHKQLQEIYVTGITGATGAGHKLQHSSHFAWRANNIQAYRSLDHQHISEIRQTLASMQPALPEINFIPWRGDFPRGIFVTAYTDCDMDIADIYTIYKDYYARHPFTHVSDTMIDLKQVVNTNKCLLHLEKQGTKLIIHATIDNLLKGAAGQAVQNMNLMFDLPEETGLQLKANAF